MNTHSSVKSSSKNLLFVLASTTLLTLSVFTIAFSLGNPKETRFGLAALPGNCNTDLVVNVQDYVLMSGTFLKVPGDAGYNAACNFNSQAIVDLSDYAILSANFGRTDTGGNPTSTPPPPPPPAGSVDPNTMNKKFMFGYQGWFQTRCDGSPSATWRHWFNGTPPSGLLVDQWPEVSEYAAGDLCDTGLRLPNGQPARLFSAYSPGVVLKHFQWMQQYGIDGVMLQRFGNEISPGSAIFQIRNKVTDNVRAGAEQTGRVWNIMYDITGTPGNVATTLINDWKYLVDTKRVTSSPRYLKHNGLPVVVIWGFGFGDRPGSPADLRTVLDFFHNNSNSAYKAFVMGGVNNDWRTNGTWAAALKGYDAISPWMVGRINGISGADGYRSTYAAEVAQTRANGQLYMPVIFPGFSFGNQSGSGFNKIPRLGGNFVWRQAYNTLSAGATTLYGAMFDEVNEGTAFFKQATNSQGWPSGMTMVPLNNIDGYTQIPSDWYLRVSGEITKMVRGQIPLSQTMSITPR